MTLIFQDTMGYIFGSLSPDKYIVIGTSFDSMGPGASTTAHGYAVLTELIRVITEHMKLTGWKPSYESSHRRQCRIFVTDCR